MISSINEFKSLSINSQPHSNTLSLDKLPQDILSEIIKYLGLKSLISLIQVSKFFFNLSFIPTFAFPRQVVLLKGEGISAALHDIALGILVVGWCEERYTESHPFVNGAVYDLKRGVCSTELECKKLEYVDCELRHLIIDSTGQRIIGGLKTKTLAVWNLSGTLEDQVDTSKEIRFFIHLKETNQIAALPSNVNQLSLFNLKEEQAILPVHPSVITITPPPEIYHSKSRQLMFRANGDRSIQMIHAKDLSLIQQFPSMDKHFVYSDKNHALIYTNDQKEICILQLDTQVNKKLYQLSLNEDMHHLFYHEKTERVIAVFKGLETNNEKKVLRIWIKIWDVATQKMLNNFMTVSQQDLCHFVNMTLYLPEINILMTSGGFYDSEICFWDLQEETLAKVIKLPKECSTTQISYCPDTYQMYVTQHSQNRSFTSCHQFIRSTQDLQKYSGKSNSTVLRV